MKMFLGVLITIFMIMTLSSCVFIEIEPSDNGKVPQFESEVVLFEIDSEYPRYNAIVKITNTGDSIINLGYSTFSVEDENNHLIATESSTAVYSQPKIVKPGEVGYFFAQRLELPTNFDRTLTYNLVYDTACIRSVDIEKVVDFEVTDVSFPEGDYTKIIGKVVNAPYSGYADVWCICYDKDHNIVNMSGTGVEIGSGKTSIFEIYNYAAYDKTDIVEYEIFARGQ